MVKKRGLSPILATSLLVVIVIIIAVIILVWARSYIGEGVQKDLGNGPQAIETLCEQIKFDAESTTSTLHVLNKGNVPIRSVEVIKVSSGSTSSIALDAEGVLNLFNGREKRINYLSSDLSTGDIIEVIPVILGESGGGKKIYKCESMSIEAEVK